MGNCMSNTGKFEEPWAKAVNAYVTEHDALMDPVQIRLRDAEKRASAAEKRVSSGPPPAPPKPKGPKCSVCFKHCQVAINPWQRTKSDLMVADVSDSDDEDENGIAEIPADEQARPKRAPRRAVTHGIQLQACKHYFCGACLAAAIYHSLNIAFDPMTYGTKVPSVPAAQGRRADFPISCPVCLPPYSRLFASADVGEQTCQVKAGEEPVEISDMTARLVLGESNMDEWNHARFLSTLNLLYCPHKGCNEAFDADDVAPAPSGVEHAETLVQCPRCRGSLCKTCKVVWHEHLTCEEYQAQPITERAPEDVAFAILAKQEKWRRCPKCSAMVELKFGCNHITCTCKHHFCYTCGADFEHKGGKYRCKGGKGCKVWEEQNLIARE
ncbi:hypothetical protein C8J57DRAFT_137915 [Mycena rebaudengoi]|nr:hypothetical protein C8J57DRAFT_137915 [Mycena rebaudengoi]